MPQYKLVGKLREALPIIEKTWEQYRENRSNLLDETAFDRYTHPDFYMNDGTIHGAPNFLALHSYYGKIESIPRGFTSELMQFGVNGRVVTVLDDCEIYQIEFFGDKEEPFLEAAKRINEIINILRKAGSKQVAYDLRHDFDQQFDGCLNAWGDSSLKRYRKDLIAFKNELEKTFKTFL